MAEPDKHALASDEVFDIRDEPNGLCQNVTSENKSNSVTPWQLEVLTIHISTPLSGIVVDEARGLTT